MAQLERSGVSQSPTVIIPRKASILNSFDFDAGSDDALEESSSPSGPTTSTWRLTAGATTSACGLSESIRLAWDSLDLEMTSTTLAEIAFINRVRQTYCYGARPFKIQLPHDSTSAKQLITDLLEVRLLNMIITQKTSQDAMHNLYSC